MNKEIIQQRRIALVREHASAVATVQNILGAIIECDNMAKLLDDEEKAALAAQEEKKK